jgi:hypothetical protein
MLLTLSNLQHTMDLLVAAKVYDDRFSPSIGRLPEELLLCILDFLHDDPVTLNCLCIVSRTFRRLLYTLPEDYTMTRVPIDLRLQFQRFLQNDERCNNCRRWNDVHSNQLFSDSIFQQDYRVFSLNRNSHGVSSLYRRLHCYACQSSQDVCQFSSAFQRRCEQPERQCRGQQGSVELSEHVQITWASIKPHIDDWRQQQRNYEGGDWQACLDSFKIECHDICHDMRCTTSEAAT